MTFGANVRSIGPSAFRDCAALQTAAFTGERTPDYYGPDEEKPSFPQTCRVNARPGAESWRTQWEDKTQAMPGQKADGGAAREMPYYWTMALNNADFSGAGIYADVKLEFDGGMLRVFVNDREASATPFSADANAEPDARIVRTEGFYCRDGVVTDLSFRDGYRSRDAVLTATLTADDGTISEVVFHTESEETLYLDVN